MPPHGADRDSPESAGTQQGQLTPFSFFSPVFSRFMNAKHPVERFS
jgi:hypothetical protein